MVVVWSVEVQSSQSINQSPVYLFKLERITSATEQNKQDSEDDDRSLSSRVVAITPPDRRRRPIYI